jgi:1-acyl-sn-glycerol-3-phosphate acyltransferase
VLILPWFWRFVLQLSRMLLTIRTRREVRIQGPVPRGAVLVCAKHGSGLDVPAMADFGWRARRSRSYFEMGSFVGYPVLGSIVPLMRRCGGFPVMRPKEVLRLRNRPGWSRETALARMAEVNAEAERIREQIFRAGELLVVFPEGTRDDSRVRPIASEAEIETACRVAAEGIPVSVWPVVISYGPRKRFRRRLVIEAFEPFDASVGAPEVQARVQAVFAERWIPPALVGQPVPSFAGR